MPQRPKAMKHPRLAISAMAAVHLLLFILLVLSWEPWEELTWILYSCVAIFASQGCLLGLWVALGGKPTPWRAVLVVIVAAVWGWSMQGQQHQLNLATSEAVAVLTGQTFQVMGILLLARFMGLALETGGHGSENQIRHLQFSVGQALSWMTAFAVFMAATHYLKNFFSNYFDIGQACFFLSFLAVTLAAMWLIFGSRWVALRCLTLLVQSCLGTIWISRFLQERWWPCAALLGCEAVVTAASLLVVRLAGYRLTWHWPFRRAKP